MLGRSITEIDMWSIFQRRIDEAERQAGIQYLRQLCKLVGTFDRDAEEYNQIFDRFNDTASPTSADAEQLETTANRSENVAGALSSTHSAIADVPPVAQEAFNAWTEAFKEYFMFAAHRALNAGFLAKHGRAPLDQTLHMQHYHRFSKALSTAQRHLKKLARRLSVSNEELAEWFVEGRAEMMP